MGFSSLRDFFEKFKMAAIKLITSSSVIEIQTKLFHETIYYVFGIMEYNTTHDTFIPYHHHAKSKMPP